MTLKSLVEKAHERAKRSGWWDPGKSALEIHMLIVSEVAEATEECRVGAQPFYFKGEKPEGEAVELADAIIRIADYFGHKNWDLEAVIREKMAYNETRPHRHGGKLY